MSEETDLGLEGESPYRKGELIFDAFESLEKKYVKDKGKKEKDRYPFRSPQRKAMKKIWELGFDSKPPYYDSFSDYDELAEDSIAESAESISSTLRKIAEDMELDPQIERAASISGIEDRIDQPEGLTRILDLVGQTLDSIADKYREYNLAIESSRRKIPAEGVLLGSMNAAAVITDVRETLSDGIGYEGAMEEIRNIDEIEEALHFMPSYISEHEGIDLEDLRNFSEENEQYSTVMMLSNDGNEYAFEPKPTEELLKRF